ncbi:hypothetical protein [Zhongshania arctica]|uniref:Lipocalin-like domain-containing protein n=1 Tax=Zhongshania arctica TaxID=3238302 RepID=A0ABV3TR74_9GAMM
MKKLLSFTLLSMLLVGCSQFKITKPLSSANLHKPMQADDNSQPDDVSDIQILASSASRNMLLGKWYGIRTMENGGQKEWLTERSADGTYRVDFRFVDTDGSARSQSEVGFWGVSGDIYFRIFRGWVTVEGMKPADPTVADHYDAYKIEGLDDNAFSYIHLTRNQRYTVKKVPTDFRLPITVKSKETEPLTFSY